MKLTIIFSALALTSAAAVDEDHLALALDLAKEQGTAIEARDVGVDVEKRGFLLLAKLKYLWAAKMASYNVCYQCGGSICGSSCCQCGSPCTYQCSGC